MISQRQRSFADSELIFTVTLCALVCLFTWAVTRVVLNDQWQKDAVAASHAEFYLDAQSNRQWRWKTNSLVAPTFLSSSSSYTNYILITNVVLWGAHSNLSEAP